MKPVRNHVGVLDFRTFGNEVGLLETKAVLYKMANGEQQEKLKRLYAVMVVIHITKIMFQGV